jgi:DNA-binding MarR family transcriptional regulator
MPWNTDPHDMPLAQLFANVCRLATVRLRSHIERIGLHSSQGRVLVHLHQQDDVPQWRIARAMNTSPAAMTSILQRMERDGWITRRRDPHDQRTVRIKLSEKAKALEDDVRAAFMQIEEEMSSAYTDEEKRELHHLLLKLHDKFSAHEDESTKVEEDDQRRE